MTIKSSLSVIWASFVGVICFIVTLLIAGVYFIPRYDVGREYGKENVKASIAGTWVHTNTLCRGMVDYTDIVEFTAGKELPRKTVNPIHLDKYQTFIEAANDEEIAWVKEWLVKCEHFKIKPDELEFIRFHYDNYLHQKTLVFIPNINLVLQNTSEGILNFIPQKMLMELTPYRHGVKHLETVDRQ